jgi:hypothetical protein
MKTKKINDRHRIKISWKILDKLNFQYYEVLKYTNYFKEYGLEMTSRRIARIYFRLVDPKKYTVFILKYSEFIL